MSVKFIDTEYTGFDAAGAETLAAKPLGYIMDLQSQRFAFRLANTSNSIKNYQVTASGQNATINAEVEFSMDKVSYYGEVCFSGIQPNGITDPIWCKFTPTDEMFLTSGTFLIQASEVV